MKYQIGDKVIFKYMDEKRLGIIDLHHSKRNLKKEIIYYYNMKDMAKDICIRENNILGKVLYNVTKISKKDTF